MSTADTAQGVETARLSCGGHGYMLSSNLPTTYGLATAMCTYEGENTVMLLQTARYLMKAWQNVVEGKNLTPTVEYLARAKTTKVERFERSPVFIIAALQKVAAG